MHTHGDYGHDHVDGDLPHVHTVDEPAETFINVETPEPEPEHTNADDVAAVAQAAIESMAEVAQTVVETQAETAQIEAIADAVEAQAEAESEASVAESEAVEAVADASEEIAETQAVEESVETVQEPVTAVDLPPEIEERADGKPRTTRSVSRASFGIRRYR